MDVFSESLAEQEGLLTETWLRHTCHPVERSGGKVEEVCSLLKLATWWGEVKALVNENRT